MHFGPQNNKINVVHGVLAMINFLANSFQYSPKNS